MLKFPRTAARQSVSPSLEFALAQSEAKVSEEQNYTVAKSKDEYHKLCRDVVEKLIEEAKLRKNSIQPLDYRADHECDGIQIGTYKNATFFRDGLVSTVYKSERGDGELVALKITTPSVITPPHDSIREARILRSAFSPNVIPLLETFTLSGGRFVLAFPFMLHDLSGMLKEHVLTMDQVRSHLKDLFLALAHIHSMGIIHRDVKPSNILLASASGPAYLADFGITWAPNDSASEPARQKFTDVGTTSYRPPELLFGNTDYGTSLDLWAAGCVVAEAVRLDSRTLFTSGDLGSELALLQSIFSTLGTPNVKIWPESKDLPDWGKVAFREYPVKSWLDILPDVPDNARNLVASLVRYESGDRLTAIEALNHPFFATAP